MKSTAQIASSDFLRWMSPEDVPKSTQHTYQVIFRGRAQASMGVWRNGRFCSYRTNRRFQLSDQILFAMILPNTMWETDPPKTP